MPRRSPVAAARSSRPQASLALRPRVFAAVAVAVACALPACAAFGQVSASRRRCVVVRGAREGRGAAPAAGERDAMTGAARRRVAADVFGAAASCGLVFAPAAANAAKVSEFDYAVNGRVYGIEEDAPFRSALGKIRGLLDDLGVEGAATPDRPVIPDGPLIKRRYDVGLVPGTDRLRKCADGESCVSSTRSEEKSKTIPHFVFFDQKGDAVGNLLELVYSAADADVLVAKGNFFNGAGVYVLVELNDVTERGTSVQDVEFQFLPGVLENVVDIRITCREGATTLTRQRDLLNVFAKAVGWVPLDTSTLNMNVFSDEEKGIITTSALEIKYREQFEAEMEKADAELNAQMAKERQRIEQLKKEVEKLLDDLSRQEDARVEDYRNLRSRTATARAEYEEGINKRIGGVANDGRYAASQNIRLGNSFAGLINSKDDITAKIYDNVQQDEDAGEPPPKKNLFGQAVKPGKGRK